MPSGELPLWNPYHFGGHPSAADPQSLLFTPTMLLFGWLVPEPSMQLFDVVVFAHFLPGALAFVPLFRRRGWHPAGAVVAAIVFMLGGSATARLQHTGMIFSYGFFPLALWLLEEALDRRSYRYGVLFALERRHDGHRAGSGRLPLRPDAHRASRRTGSGARRSPSPISSRASACCCPWACIGGALLAVPVVLTMQFLATSTRPSFGFGVAAMGSLPPESLATILFGNVFGSLRWTYDYWGPDWHSLAEGTWTDRATNYLFVGTIPALLLLWHGIAGGRLFAREFRFFLVLGLVALLYALGRYTPGFEVIFDHLPGRQPLPPAGRRHLPDQHRPRLRGRLPRPSLRRRTGCRDGAGPRSAALDALLPLLAFGLVVAAIASALVFAIQGGHVPSAHARDRHGTRGRSRRHRLLIARRADRPAGAGPWRLVLVTLTGAELIGRHAASALNAEPAERYAVFTQASARAAPGPADPQAGTCRAQRPRRVSARRDPRPRAAPGRTPPWCSGSRTSSATTPCASPITSAPSARARTPRTPTCASFPTTFRGYECRLASLLGLEYLVLDRPLDKLPRHFPRLTDAEVVYGTGQMWIYRLNTSSPRAYVAHHVTPVDSEAVLDQDELPEFNRETEALIDDESMQLAQGRAIRRPAARPEQGQGRGAHRQLPAQLGRDRGREQRGRRARPARHLLSGLGGLGRRRAAARSCGPTSCSGASKFRPGKHRVEFQFRPMSIENLVAAASDLVKSEDEPIRTAIAVPAPMRSLSFDR